ncbi:contact-dependent growth inhibition system immunity protein [Nocardioides sp.]|jgi:hypothetical protein|uniref:contact-dependent growth inhibition system immunity protein n=1 Tax=Nocardioides sp. TaxID=35761 RepID=UPI001DF1D86D|nr:contact-dependent growth inhibition system immunity protein [Nocardioides sp.]MBU1803233.1 hypothetical protein [Actinomycetota bacterium]
MRNVDEASELTHFLSVYYGEDFETWWSGLDQYLDDDPPEDQQELIQEIEHVLADRTRTDEQLGDLLESRGFYGYLSDTPGGYRGWLEEIARRVRAHLADA